MLLKGKPVARKILAKVREKVSEKISLSVFHPAGDEAAESYLKSKKKVLESVGFALKVIEVTREHDGEWLKNAIEVEGADPSVHGIMVELPLPFEFDEGLLQSWIPWQKDVDGISFINQGILFSSRKEEIVPCTAMAAVRMLEHYGFEFEGKNAVVVGRSKIVGLPAAKLLLNRNSTVTVAHSRTRNLRGLVAAADVVIVATGRHGVIRSSWLGDGAWLVDVGINFVDAKLKGDAIIDSEDEAERINYTPVPGGVGPVTNAILAENLFKTYLLGRN